MVNELWSFTLTQFLDCDYDQYYASLVASAASSAQATPALPDLSSNFGDKEKDAPVKLSVEDLDSLNDYRKRSRSREDVEILGGPMKTPRTNGHETSSPPHINGVELLADVGFAMNGTEIDVLPGDDPTVYGSHL